MFEIYELNYRIKIQNNTKKQIFFIFLKVTSEAPPH